MRYIAHLYVKDTRAEKPENAKKDATAPEGGWRSKSGVRKLGDRAEITADTLGGALSKVAELVDAIPADAQANIVRLKVETDSTDPATGANPFLS